MPEKTVRVIIEGRVQGVWFRGWTAEEAQRRAIRGWVRNRRNGTVEAVFSGDASDVDDLILACRQGPPMARVDNITEYPCDFPEKEGFGYLPTV